MIIGALLAVSAAWKLRRLDDRAFDRLVAGVGIFLAVTEIFKQICLFRAAGGHYDWWYFPFQLCSMPMYMCLACTFSHSGRVRRLLCTFMHNFSLLGALAVIFDTSGLYHESLLLTAHSFLWHILIIFLGALIGFSGRMDVSWKGYPGFGAPVSRPVRGGHRHQRVGPSLRRHQHVLHNALLPV